jgi:mannan endo-1,4-beta-mannosidase
MGRHRHATYLQGRRGQFRRRWLVLIALIGFTGAALAMLFTFAVPSVQGPGRAVPSARQHSEARHSALRHESDALVTTSGAYIGLYQSGFPNSYSGVAAFTRATGVDPRVVLYYSGWLQPFQTSFATSAAKHGAVPLVQLCPTGISIAAIASGQYDDYLRTFAKAVRAFRHPVILSFGHEMNGYWYSWGYQHTAPGVFVAAWRHVVTLFRALGVKNVTWMWTINTIHPRARVPSPGPWWPGSSYVNWVGIDGYYYNASTTFAPLFGPTIVAVRALTHDPILIAETAVAPAAGQIAKIGDLFSGVHLYGLLGFVWFDSDHVEDWRLTSRAALVAFGEDAKKYQGLSP